MIGSIMLLTVGRMLGEDVGGGIAELGSVVTFDGAEMNLPQTILKADVDELVVEVTLERKQAVVSKSLIPS